MTCPCFITYVHSAKHSILLHMWVLTKLNTNTHTQTLPIHLWAYHKNTAVCAAIVHQWTQHHHTAWAQLHVVRTKDLKPKGGPWHAMTTPTDGCWSLSCPHPVLGWSLSLQYLVSTFIGSCLEFSMCLDRVFKLNWTCPRMVVRPNPLNRKGAWACLDMLNKS